MAADPAGARARLRQALDAASAAMNELVTRGAEAKLAITVLVSNASLARSVVGTPIAAVQAQLQTRRIAHLASMQLQSATWKATASAKAATLSVGAATSSLLPTGDARAPAQAEDGNGDDGGEAKRRKRDHAPAPTTTETSNTSVYFSVAGELLALWQSTLSALYPQMVIVQAWSL
jgi:hypothetical protein